MSSREEMSKDMQEEIENEEKRKIIKKITLLFFKIIFMVTTLFIAFYLYTRYIATLGLIFKENRIVSSKLPDSFNSMKIIHFSDLHYGSTIELEEVKKLVKEINLRKPDIIIFTGDLIEANYSASSYEMEKLINELKKLSAPVGMYATIGDEDNEDTFTILKQIGFIILDNSNDLIYNNSNIPILITGINSNAPNIESAFSEYSQNNNLYHIMIMHGADIFDEIAHTYNADLVLAGGSLNGQVCFTSNLCLVQKEGSYNYFKEFYQIGNTKMFISSGIGSCELGFRMGARPSVNFLRFATN